MKVIYLFSILILLPLTLQAQTWQEKTRILINEIRADANARELAIYGNYQYGERLPLKYNTELEASEQWWCEALRNTKGRWFGHFGYINDRPRNGVEGGFLIDPRNNRQIGTIWLPSYNTPGQTFWVDRLRYNDVLTQGSSENGVQLNNRNFSAENVVGAWMHGYNADPRKAQYHYLNLTYPLWTDYGVAEDNFAKGDVSVFGAFARIVENK